MSRRDRDETYASLADAFENLARELGYIVRPNDLYHTGASARVNYYRKIIEYDRFIGDQQKAYALCHELMHVAEFDLYPDKQLYLPNAEIVAEFGAYIFFTEHLGLMTDEQEQAHHLYVAWQYNQAFRSACFEKISMYQSTARECAEYMFELFQKREHTAAVR